LPWLQKKFSEVCTLRNLSGLNEDFSSLRISLTHQNRRNFALWRHVTTAPVELLFDRIPKPYSALENNISQPPLDEGIREIVIALISNGVEAFESCEGGHGHSFPEPTVRFEGASSEGLRAVSVALENGLPIRALRRVWSFKNDLIHGPWWEMTFWPTKGSLQLAERDTQQ
jgi:hypothetical protein